MKMIGAEVSEIYATREILAPSSGSQRNKTGDRKMNRTSRSSGRTSLSMTYER